MRMSDWSSDVCSSDLRADRRERGGRGDLAAMAAGSDRRQRLIEIGDEILGVLHADRDADEIVRNVELPLAFVRHGKMGHRGRVAGKRLGAAKADGELPDLARIEESERLRLRPEEPCVGNEWFSP